MNSFEPFKDILSNPHTTTDIIYIQIPTVLCLAIQCYQAYKLGFKEFKIITIAWITNLIYLFINIFFRKVSFVNDDYKLLIRTFFDLTTMYYFLIGIVNIIEIAPFDKLKKLPKKHIIAIFLIAGVVKVIPGSLHIVPYVHLRFVPVAILDFFVLFLLANFFKRLGKNLEKKSLLFYTTLFYSAIQFLSILQIDRYEKNFILLNIDTIGFGLGLLCKIGILVSLSLLLIADIKASSEDEKRKLLSKLNFTTKILDLKDTSFLSKEVIEQENFIIESVLKECIIYLNVRLGYYGMYNDKKSVVHIMFASAMYSDQIGSDYPSIEGITGSAIKTKKVQIMQKPSERPDYIRFSNTSVDKDVKSAVAVPMILDEQVIGIYIIESDWENHFTSTDIEIIEALVSQASTAIKNIRLVRENQMSKTLLESLKTIDKSLLIEKSLELKNILKTILDYSLELVNGELGNIALKRNRELVLFASTNAENIEKKLDINDSISGLAVLEKRRIYIPNINEAEEKIQKLYKNYLDNNITFLSELVVPLIAQNEVIGIINIESSEANMFSHDDIEKVEGFAGQAAIAVYITQLIEDINDKNIALENSVGKMNMDMAINLGNFINHRIGNQVGYIKASLEDLKAEQFDTFDNSLKEEIERMLKSAKEVIDSSEQISDSMKKLLMSSLTPIDYSEVKLRIEKNERFSSINNIKIEIQGFEEMEPNLANINLMMEIFFEFLSNAIKAMPNGGKILLIGNTEDNENIIEIKDEGCGIKKENLDNIFNRGWSEWVGSNTGGGIGLSQINTMIKILGGNIKVTSEINRGTIFIIRFPIYTNKN